VAQSAKGTMSGVGEVFLNVVAPVIGLTLANVMFFSGVPAMLRCKREGSLGDMNPGPFPVVLANCVGWMGYSLLIHDYFLFFGNAPASMVGMYFTLVGYGLSAPASETRRTMERLVMGLMGATLAVVFYLGMVAVDTGATAGDKRSVMGVFCNFVLLLYYAVPLSTIREVLETRDSRSLFAPMAAANTANGLAWFCYGIALNDAYLMAPNGIGAALGITQLALIRAYPAKRGGAFTSGGGAAARPPSASASAQDLLRAHDEERAATERGHETRA
jgi:solute carrier family 50 protein (sugar transporter)